MVRFFWMAQYLQQLLSSSGVVIDRAAFQKGGTTRMWLKAELLVVCVQRVTRLRLLQASYNGIRNLQRLKCPLLHSK